MKQGGDFDGTTYIQHGGDHNPAEPNEDSLEPAIAAESQPATGIRDIEERLQKLESEFETYKETVEKKMKILEKIAKNQKLTPQERVLQIQEDA